MQRCSTVLMSPWWEMMMMMMMMLLSFFPPTAQEYFSAWPSSCSNYRTSLTIKAEEACRGHLKKWNITEKQKNLSNVSSGKQMIFFFFFLVTHRSGFSICSQQIFFLGWCVSSDMRDQAGLHPPAPSNSLVCLIRCSCHAWRWAAEEPGPPCWVFRRSAAVAKRHESDTRNRLPAGVAAVVRAEIWNRRRRNKNWQSEVIVLNFSIP